MKKIGIISIIFIILDALIKIIVMNNLILNESIKIINGFFYITYVHNMGAAWSILSGGRFFLILIALIALVLIYFVFLKKDTFKKIEIITYGLLIGGIIGNLIDRIIYGYVIDYLDFIILGYDFPIFNLADILIVISTILIIIYTFIGDKNESSI